MKKILFNSGSHSLASSFGLLLLRVGVGLTMLLGHGLGKMNKISDGETGFMDPLKIGELQSLYLVTFAELVCAGLIVLGLLTRLASIPLVVAMAVAAFMVHGNDPWFMANAVDGGPSKELALLFLAGFAALLFTGPGKLSLDGFFGRAKSRPAS